MDAYVAAGEGKSSLELLLGERELLLHESLSVVAAVTRI